MRSPAPIIIPGGTAGWIHTRAKSQAQSGEEGHRAVFPMDNPFIPKEKALRNAPLSPSESGVGAQYFKVWGQFPEMAERIEAFPAAHVAPEIEVEQVLPRSATNGT